jgi:hypothetical protein
MALPLYIYTQGAQEYSISVILLKSQLLWTMYVFIELVNLYIAYENKRRVLS